MRLGTIGFNSKGESFGWHPCPATRRFTHVPFLQRTALREGSCTHGCGLDNPLKPSLAMSVAGGGVRALEG